MFFKCMRLALLIRVKQFQNLTDSLLRTIYKILLVNKCSTLLAFLISQTDKNYQINFYHVDIIKLHLFCWHVENPRDL